MKAAIDEDEGRWVDEQVVVVEGKSEVDVKGEAEVNAEDPVRKKLMKEEEKNLVRQ